MRSDTKSKQNNVKTKSATKQTQFQSLIAKRLEEAHAAYHAEDKKPSVEALSHKEASRAAFLRRKEKGLK